MRAPPAPNPLVIDLAAALRAATFLQGLHMLGARTNPHTMTLLGKQIATIEPKREIGDEVDLCSRRVPRRFSLRHATPDGKGLCRTCLPRRARRQIPRLYVPPRGFLEAQSHGPQRITPRWHSFTVAGDCPGVTMELVCAGDARRRKNHRTADRRRCTRRKCRRHPVLKPARSAQRGNLCMIPNTRPEAPARDTGVRREWERRRACRKI
jgi:hypothetical protein